MIALIIIKLIKLFHCNIQRTYNNILLYILILFYNHGYVIIANMYIVHNIIIYISQ